jgi:hypothetical protein
MVSANTHFEKWWSKTFLFCLRQRRLSLNDDYSKDYRALLPEMVRVHFCSVFGFVANLSQIPNS